MKLFAAVLAAASAVNVAEEAALAAPTPVDTDLVEGPTDTLAEEDFDHESILAQVPTDLVSENLLEEGEDKRRKFSKKAVRKWFNKLRRCLNKKSKSKKCKKMYRRARRAAKKIRKAVRKCMKNRFRHKKCKRLARRLKKAFKNLKKAVKVCKSRRMKNRWCRILKSKLRKIMRRVRALRKRTMKKARKMVKKCRKSKSKVCRRVRKWAKKLVRKALRSMKKKFYGKRCHIKTRGWGQWKKKWYCRFLKYKLRGLRFALKKL